MIYILFLNYQRRYESQNIFCCAVYKYSHFKTCLYYRIAVSRKFHTEEKTETPYICNEIRKFFPEIYKSQGKISGSHCRYKGSRSSPRYGTYERLRFCSKGMS